MKKTVVALAMGAVLALGLGSGAAFAGEVTGGGKPTPAGDKAASSCAFSGLEDEPVAPGTTQNWGQIIRELGPQGGPNSVESITLPDGTVIPIEEGCNANQYPNKWTASRAGHIPRTPPGGRATWRRPLISSDPRVLASGASACGSRAYRHPRLSYCTSS